MLKNQTDRSQIAKKTDLAAVLRAYCAKDLSHRFILMDWGNGFSSGHVGMCELDYKES